MFDNDFYQYAYSKIGTRYYESQPGHYKKRISMIVGLNNNNLQAPFMFEGHCNTKLFELYIEKILLARLNKDMVVIMDNASFHKSAKIKELINSVGCELIFLPPYSPDLNPIEHYWHQIKTYIRKKIKDTNASLSKAMEDTLKNMCIC